MYSTNLLLLYIQATTVLNTHTCMHAHVYSYISVLLFFCGWDSQKNDYWANIFICCAHIYFNRKLQYIAFHSHTSNNKGAFFISMLMLDIIIFNIITDNLEFISCILILIFYMSYVFPLYSFIPYLVVNMFLIYYLIPLLILINIWVISLAISLRIAIDILT